MENLDDLPTGGRVTRSLRKRLNSVDSEASSSRCGTPTNQKLPPITEISIASSRTTRANTPVKTPSKGRGIRGVTPDINSPARRLTRRSSISIVEDEHPKTNGKEIELEALQEEGSKTVSKSKPAQTKTTSANSSTKRMTRRNSVQLLENDEVKEENLETLSDVSEVISVPNSEDITTSATKENALKSERAVRTSSRTGSASPTKTVVKSQSEQLNTDVQIINLMSDDSSRDVDFVEIENVPELKPTNANDTSKQEQDETAIESEKEKQQEKNKSNTSPKISTEVVYIKKLKQSDIARYTNKPTETAKDDAKGTKSVTETTKRVSLNASDDDTEKKKYPKTPAITKSKSYIENNSEKDTGEEEKSFTSDRISRASLKLSKDDTESNANEPNSSKESVEFHDATDVPMDSDHEKNKEDMADPCKSSFSFADKTPYKTRLSCNVKSSTPFVETVAADKKTELRERQKENIENEIKNIKESGSDEDVHNKSGNSSKHSFELDPELLTPEKCLRSGKTYGSTPPLISPRESPSLHNKSPNNKADKEKSTPVSTVNETSKNTSESVEEKVVEDKTTESSNKSTNEEENSSKKDKSISDAQVVSESTESKANEVPFTRSWSPSVCGKADAAGQKIDTITDASEVKEKVGEIIEDKTNFNTSTTERFHYEPDNDEDEEPTNVNEDADDDDDDSDDEEKEKEKNEFIDNEAEEAPKDYQSGDSMDEEERNDMEENDIPIDGESIGSEDTDEEDAVDDDASKDSFIVEDEEVDLLEYSDDDDECFVESKKSKSKRSSGSFRRIMVPSSDSDSDTAEQGISKSKTNTRRQSITGKSKAALTLDVTKMIDDSMTDDDETKNASKVDEGEAELKLNSQEEKDLKDDESLRLVATEESDSESMETLNISKSFNQSQSDRKSNRNVLDSTDKDEKSSFKETLKKFLNTSNRTSNVSQNRDESDADKDSKRSTDVAAAAASKESENESDSVEEEEENDQQEVVEAEKKAKTVEVENDEESDDDDEDKDEKGVGEKEEDDEDLAENEEEEEDEVVAEVEEEEEVVEVETIAEEDEDTKEKSKEDEEVEEDDKEGEDKEEEEEEDDEEDDKEEEEVGEDDDEDIEEKEEDGGVEEEDEGVEDESIEHDKENSIRRKKKRKIGAFEHGESNSSQNEAKESEQEPDQDLLKQQPTTKKRKSAGLSVSFDHTTTSNKAYEVVEENMYSSFTIGVKVTKKPQKSLKKDKITVETAGGSNSDATSNVQQLLSSDEEEHLEKLKGNEQVTINKSQRRLTLNTSDGSITSVKRRKLERNSICLPIDEEMPMSHSFTETISKRKSTIRQQQLPTSIDEENVSVQKEVETSTEQIKEPSSSTSGSPTKTNAAKRNDNSIQYILSRCDEILGAANEAKLEAKRNFKKSKVRQRKKQSKKQTDLASTSTSADTSETTEMDESMEKRRKEEVKNAVEQALKASVNILLNPPDKKKIKHQSQAQNTNKSEEEERNKLASKRLPDDILAAIAKDEPEHEHEHISHVAKKKKQTVAHKEQENLGGVKKVNSVAGEFIEAPLTPIKKKMSKIETATGPFLVEPLTPKHKTNISGFRESPITPRTIGYKVRQILTAGQDTPPTLAASTSSSSSSLSSSSSRARKRRRNIEEPTHTLPRTVWTNSGGFLEQDIKPTRNINVAGCATKFMVSALKGSTKSKKFKTNSNAAVNASALQFKETALVRSNAKRESSRELLLRKQRLNEHRSNKHA